MYRIGIGSSFVRFERCLCDTCATRTKGLESHPYCLLPLALSQLGTCGFQPSQATAPPPDVKSEHLYNLTPPDVKSEHLY